MTSASEPHYLRITRVGDNFTAYKSTDGSTWTQVGSAQAGGGYFPNPRIGIAAWTSAAVAWAPQYDWIRMTPYVSSGSVTSVVYDFSAASAWGTISWTAMTPSGTTLTIETRTGDVSAPDATWSAWAAQTNGTTITSPGPARYIQYRATLSTTDTAITPTLSDITINAKSGCDIWERGTPSAVGPSADHTRGSNSYAWGTKISANYGLNHLDSRLISPCMVIPSGIQPPTLSFWHYSDSQNTYDGGVVEITTNGGSTWTQLTPTGGYPVTMNAAAPSFLQPSAYSSSSGGWIRATFDLSSYIGNTIRSDSGSARMHLRAIIPDGTSTISKSGMVSFSMRPIHMALEPEGQAVNMSSFTIIGQQILT